MSSRADEPSVTELLLAWGSGDQGAFDALLPIVYDELRRQAARALRGESPEHTLQPTALVHEAYFRLVDQHRVQFQNRAHFFGVAAQMIRRILIDHARARRAAKRGGGGTYVTLGHADAQQETNESVDVLDLHEALDRLAALDPDQAKIVELRYFGGLTVSETAEALPMNPRTVDRDWAAARVWLRRRLRP